MPQPAKINAKYGRREVIGQALPDGGRNLPMYLLLEAKDYEDGPGEGQPEIAGRADIASANQKTGPGTRITKCWCPDCQKIQDISIDMPANTLDMHNIEGQGCQVPPNTWNFSYREQDDIPVLFENLSEAACPECGRKAADGFSMLRPQETGEGLISWQTPEQFLSRTISKYVAEDDGRTTGVQDLTRTGSMKFMEQPDGTIRTEAEQTVTAEMTDLLKNSIYITRGPAGDLAHSEKKDHMDPFFYPKRQQSIDAHELYGARTLGDVAALDTRMSMEHGMLGWNPILSGAKGREFADITRTEAYGFRDGKPFSKDMDEGTTLDMTAIVREKVRAIEGRFSATGIDPVYLDGEKGRFYLSEHHPGSTEENTAMSLDKMCSIAALMALYPGAYLYSAERADAEVQDQHYAEIRKQNADPSHEIREISDNGKARLFRDQLSRTMMQMSAADDNVLKAMKGAETAADIRERLRFYLDGPAEGRKNPTGIHLQADGSTLQPNPQATKKLKRRFQQEPIATASNLYTARKLNLRTKDDIDKLLDVADAFSETRPKRVRRKGQSVLQEPPACDGCRAGVIAPVRSKDMMSFMKKFANTHSATDTVQAIYGDSVGAHKTDTTVGYGLAIECLRMYGSIISDAKIADTKEELEANYEGYMTTRMQDYLERKTVKDAYVDFIQDFGKDTPAMVDKYAALARRESRMMEASAAMARDGAEGLAGQFPDITPDEVAEWDERKASGEKRTVLTTRNGKPLFQNRTLKEIHDELSVMSTKAKGANQTFEWTDEDKALEGEYDAPDGSGKWSFRLFRDSNDQVRTAQMMCNCVAGSSYTELAKNHRSALLYMQDETSDRVGCIELKIQEARDGTTKYKAAQFQGPHDNVLDPRFCGIAKQWMNDRHIDYSDCSDVMKFGTTESIYGDRNADFHHEELDEATGEVVKVGETQKRQEARLALAREIYGTLADGSIAVPEPPDGMESP